jgi:hypothetical protein
MMCSSRRGSPCQDRNCGGSSCCCWAAMWPRRVWSDEEKAAWEVPVKVAGKCPARCKTTGQQCKRLPAHPDPVCFIHMEEIGAWGGLPYGAFDDEPWECPRDDPLRQKPCERKPPSEIVQSKCKARAFPNKQCGWPQACDSDLCKMHVRLEREGKLKRGRFGEPQLVVPESQAAPGAAVVPAIEAIAAAGHEARTIIDPAKCMAKAFPNQQCKHKSKRGSALCLLHQNLEDRGRLKRGRLDDSDGGDGGDAGGDAGVERLSPEPEEAWVPEPTSAESEKTTGSSFELSDAAACTIVAAMHGPAPMVPSLPASSSAPSTSEIWNILWADTMRAVDAKSSELDELRDFTAFNEAFREEQLRSGLHLLETSVGPIGTTEQQVLTYLHWRRFHRSAQGFCSEKPVPASQLYKMLSKIRSGAAEISHMVELPQCLVAMSPHSMWLKKRLAEWTVEDAKLHKKPVQEQVLLKGSDIEDWCIAMLVKAEHGDVSDWDLCGALLLRIQSGTNLRAGNLEKDLCWRDVCSSGSRGEHGSLDVVNTKRLSAANRNLGAMMAMAGKVTRYLDDDISGQLFQMWCSRHEHDRLPQDNFFPNFHMRELIWSEALSNRTHNDMVRRCASDQGLAVGGKLLLYSSTSIRRGNQAITEELVAKFRSQRNKDNGWAKDSFVPQLHYTPESVSLAPGPLFWEVAACNLKLQQALAETGLARFNRMMCRVCAFPFPAGDKCCSCAACKQSSQIGRKAIVNIAHTCWRKGKRGKAWRELPPDAHVLATARWAVHRCNLEEIFSIGCDDAGSFCLVRKGGQPCTP